MIHKKSPKARKLPLLKPLPRWLVIACITLSIANSFLLFMLSDEINHLHDYMNNAMDVILKAESPKPAKKEICVEQNNDGTFYQVECL
jgi:hypothetical protein